MNRTSTKEELLNKFKTASQLILDDNTDISELKESVEILKKVYSEFSDIDGTNLGCGENDIRLTSGYAISPENAVACLGDIARTTKFIKGTFKAIKDCFKIFPNERIHLFYAGTGPFAPLVIPLLPFFDSKKLRISFLDIHEISIQTVEKIISELDLNEYVSGIIKADASTYNHPDNDPIHILLSETMQVGLKKEPQFSIATNLAKKLVDKGIMIPENIEVYLKMDGVKTEFNEHLFKDKEGVHVGYKKIFDLTKTNAIEIDRLMHESQGNGEVRIKANKVVIPDKVNFPLLLKISTELKIYDSICLKHGESSLTSGYYIPSKENFKKGNVLQFYYKLSDFPQFVYTFKRRESLFKRLFKY